LEHKEQGEDHYNKGIFKNIFTFFSTFFILLFSLHFSFSILTSDTKDLINLNDTILKNIF